MKTQIKKHLKRNHVANEERGQYEAPAIIFEGQITTRAGSVVEKPDGHVDPADLFGNN